MLPKLCFKTSLLAVLILSGIFVHAQSGFEKSKNAFFQHHLITTEEGLSQGLVFGIIEDYQGFLWLGTKGGLDRFDGVEFRHFYNDPNNPNSLSDNNVHGLFEDSRHRIWLATEDNYINVISEDRKSFHRIKPESPYMKPRWGEVKRFQESPSGGIVVLNRLGELLEIPSTDSWEDLKGIQTWKCEFPENLKQYGEEPFINDIAYIRDTLWIAGLNKLFYCLNHEEASPTFKEVDLFRNTELPADWDQELVRWINIIDGKLVLSTLRGKVLFLDQNAEVEELIDFRDENPMISCYAVLKDRNGVLWANTDQGIILVNLSSGERFYTNFSLAGNVSLCGQKIVQTKGGQIGIGGSGAGFYSVNPVESPFIYFGKNSRRKGMGMEQYAPQLAKGPNGEVLYLLSEIYKLNEETGALSSFAKWSSNHPGRSDDFNVNDYLFDSQGREWVATQSGLFMKKGEEVSFFSIPSENTAETIGVRRLFETHSGVIWVASGSRLFQYTEEKDDPFVIEKFSEYNFSDWENSVNSICENEDGTLWLGTSWGLFKRNLNGGYDSIPFFNQKDQQKFYKVSSIRRDPYLGDRRIWIGTTSSGLFSYEPESKEWQKFGVESGLTNTTVYSMEFDDLKRLWLSTNRGLFLCDVRDKQFVNFTHEVGLQGNEFNFLSSMKRGDKLFFGGMKGLTVFNPFDIAFSPVDEPIILLDVLSIKNGGLERLEDYSINQKEPLAFEANQAPMIRFNFSWPHFSNAQKRKFEYRITRSDEDSYWSPVTENNRVTLINQPPGSYQLEVRGSDWKGVVNTQTLSIPFVIRPPWYKSTLAIAVYFAMLLGLIYLFIRYRGQQIKLDNDLIFQRKEAERLRELETVKSRFFSNITHEFKTPLTLLLGPLDELEEKVDSRVDRSLVSMAKRNARDLLNLINQLLDINKMEEGMLPVYSMRGDLSVFISEIVARFKSLATKSNIALRADIPPGQNVVFDAVKIERILVNLISNAVKFSPVGGLIQVKLIYEIDSFQLEVHDEGPGIPINERELVFKPFYQIEGERPAQKLGTGIGLALCKEYTELLNGTIRVSTSPLGGALFSLSIPLQGSSKDAPELVIEKGLEYSNEFFVYSDGLGLSQDRPIVLIVDDHPDLRHFLSHSLQVEFETLMASNGEEGLNLAREYLPDIILSDVMMPVMDGMEMCKNLKNDESTCHIPFIFLTAKGALESKLESLELGADDYLSKPFSKEELILRMRNVLALKRAMSNSFKDVLERPEISRDSNPSLDTFIDRAYAELKKELDNTHYDVAAFCEAMGVSRTQMHRKIKAVTGLSTTHFIRAFRLKCALEILEGTDVSVKEVSYAVGFSSPSYFARAFKEVYGKSPSEYLRK